jgi:hypothetical protein
VPTSESRQAEQQAEFRAWKRLWWLGFTVGVLLAISLGTLAIGFWEFSTDPETSFTSDFLVINAFLFAILLFTFFRVSRVVRDRAPRMNTAAGIKDTAAK